MENLFLTIVNMSITATWAVLAFTLLRPLLKKVPKWIRYPMIVLILLFFTFVIVAILVLGIYILTQNIFMGIVIITIGVILLISQIIKIRKMYIDKKNDIL
jgi:hypothetical protein